MTDPITITIPAPTMKPVRKRKTGKLVTRSPWLNSNDRDHWRTTSPIVKSWNENAEAAAMAAGLPKGLVRIRIDGQVIKPRAGRYDAMNFYPTAKACVDGLVTYGLVVDDSNEYVEGPFLTAGGKGPDALVLTITSAAPDHSRPD